MSPTPDPLKTRFLVSGMTCGHCVSAVTNALKAVPGVASVKVELPGSAEIVWNAPPDERQIRLATTAVEQAGYSALPMADIEIGQDAPKKSVSSFTGLNIISDSVPTAKPALPTLPILTETKAPQIQLPILDSGQPGMASNQKDNSEIKSAMPENGLESWELSVTGMHCASCVSRVEKALNDSPGVEQAVVNLATERASVLVHPEQAALDQIRLKVRQAGYDIVKKEATLTAAEQADALRRERHERVGGWRRRLIAAGVLGLPLILMAHGSHDAAHMKPLMKCMLVGLSAVTTFFVGLPYFRGAWTLARHGSSNMDTLVSLGSLVAFGYGSWMTLVPEHSQAHFLADGVIILIMITFGKWLEARSKGSAADALEGLMDLAPRRVTAVRASGREIEIDQADLKVGMLFRVKPGEAIATDGLVVEGSANVDESMLTGESLPVHKMKDARVIGGTRNLDGALLVRAESVGAETVLQNIINAVKRAQSTKASVQALVDKVAAVFVPVVIGIALITLITWGFVLNRWSDGVLASAAVLLISCPCALGLATPMAVAVASTRAAKSGLIIRDAGVFERCDKLNYCMFDKTGTLTEGRPQVVEVWTIGNIDRDQCLRWAGAVESLSEHPLARAIANAAGTENQTLNVTDFKNDRGHGVAGRVDGLKIQVGSINWLMQNAIRFNDHSQDVLEKWSEQPRSIAGVARDGELVGLIAIEDTVRPTAAATVDRLLKMDLNVGVISGDREASVRSLAERLHIPLDDIYSQTTPEEKSKTLDRLRKGGTRVAMVGDGLNDAPALASADVSMAMASGTDVAKNAADIVIVGSDLNAVAEAISLSRATLTTIRHNLFWAFAYNVVAIPLAAIGLFQSNGPLVASVAMAFSSLTVVLRSAWLGWMKWKS